MQQVGKIITQSPKPVKLRPLTVKEGKYIKDLTNGTSGTEAVVRNYNVKKRSTAEQMSQQIKNRPAVKFAIQRALEKQGLTADKIAENITGLANTIPYKVTADVVLKANIEAIKLQGGYDKINQEESYKTTIKKLMTKDLVMTITKTMKLSQDLINTLSS